MNLYLIKYQRAKEIGVESIYFAADNVDRILDKIELLLPKVNIFVIQKQRSVLASA